jgi:HemY protein
MRLLRWLIYAAVIGIGVYYLFREPGQAVFVYGDWSVEMPLALFVILVLGAALVFGGLYVGVAFLLRAPRKWRVWRERRRELKVRASMEQTISLLARGEWREAEKAAVKNISGARRPELFRILAALACHGRGDFEKRDDHIAQAMTGANESAGNTLRFAAARMRVAARQWGEARDLLEPLVNRLPDDAEALHLLVGVCERMGAWERVGEIMYAAKSAGAIDRQQYQLLEARYHAQVIRAAADDAALEKAWKAVPSNLHAHEWIAGAYARKWIERGREDLAEPLLRAAIDRQWSLPLVDLYGRVAGKDPVKQLSNAERWLDAHGDDPILLVALARLCMKRSLWGQAQFHLDRCLNLAPNPEAYELLYALHKQQGEADKAEALCGIAVRSWSEQSTPVEAPETPVVAL